MRWRSRLVPCSRGVWWVIALVCALPLLWQRLAVPAPMSAARGGGTHGGPVPAPDDPPVTMPVWWFAPFLSGGGYSSEAISFALELSERVTLKITQHGDTIRDEFMLGLLPAAFRKLNQIAHTHVVADGAIVVCHSEPGAWVPQLFSTTPCPPVGAAYTIGRTMFETDRIPDGWVRKCNEDVDEVWVPTEAQRRIFVESGVRASQLRVVPEPVDVDVFSPAGVTPLRVPGVESEAFVFLSIFKWEERKGWDVLLRAYYSAFTAADNVVLLLLTSPFHGDDNFEEQIRAFAEEVVGIEWAHAPVVRVLRKPLAQEKMPRLFKRADAFVLPTRGEGWGRPIHRPGGAPHAHCTAPLTHTPVPCTVEAMAMALPVIVTNTTGPSAYLTRDNSYPLRSNGLVPLPRSHTFHTHRWADPSVAHLRELMRHVVAHPDEARRKGRQAREDMINHYSPRVVADVLVRELYRAQLAAEKRQQARKHDEL